MIRFLSKYKYIFYTNNVLVIILYLFPGSLIGCFLYNDCKIQPKIIDDFIISLDHFLIFFITTSIGYMTFLTSKYTSILTIYLIFLSVILELFHFLVPDRTFEVKDFFGNLLGVSVVLIIFLLFKKYAKF
ncbi:MAG: hypothetical protein FJX01_00085 [Alphaproteobacteria bacterium]|nr:hypothetical protein [Alphaproteobacteria bacterium]